MTAPASYNDDAASGPSTFAKAVRKSLIGVRLMRGSKTPAERQLEGLHPDLLPQPASSGEEGSDELGLPINRRTSA